MSDIFTFSRKRQRITPFDRSAEMRFYLDNNVILRSIPTLSRYAKASTSFDIVRANIILRGLINKMTIEEAYASVYASDMEEAIMRKEKEEIAEKLSEQIVDLPYFDEDGERILIPFFSRSINKIYDKEPWKLQEQPYKALLNEFEAISCDPFDTYGDDLYNSLFTKLIRLKKTKEGSAYYDYDAWCIYFVNKEGRLDAALYLFDRDLKNPAPNHMIEKLLPVVNAYYAGKRDEFYASLVDNRLLSSKLLGKYFLKKNPQKTEDDEGK